MKLIEHIQQRLFIRDNNGIGYDVTVEGDIEISFYEQDDRMYVFDGSNGERIDIINIPVACEETGVCLRAYVPLNAAIVIMRAYNK